MAANVLLGSPSSVPGLRRPVPGRPEILAPAGDWECVQAAIENGADAIYFGLERFNARMRAQNFTAGDLPKLMAHLHQRGVRGYVTFNTLVFPEELAEAEDYLRSIIAAGVDAAIVQDVGICQLIRALSPDFPIHCSTQMTITSAAGLAFAAELGTNLVVLARENSLADIAAMQAAQGAFDQQPGPGDRPSTGAFRPSAPLPLEVFVHGALCVAYSGQCLTSEALGGRSANRGECAQACRLPYELLADGKLVDLGSRRYLLSPQDLASLDVLPELIRLGIASLKIEGRLKSAEYVAAITRAYRQAVDRLVAASAPDLSAPAELGQDSAPTQEESVGTDLAALHREHDYAMAMTFSRGLYSGWFGGTNNQELVHANFGTKRGVFLGEVARVGSDRVALRLVAALKPGDGLVFDAGKPEDKEEGGRVYQVEPHGAETVLRFGEGDIDFRRVHMGDRVWKTSDPALEKRIRQTFQGDQIRFQRPVTIEAHGCAGAPLTVIMSDGSGHVVKMDSLISLEPAKTQPLTAERLREQLGRLGGTPYRLDRFTAFLEGEVILPVSELNRLRRELVIELDRLRTQPLRWRLQKSVERALPACPGSGEEWSPPGLPELIVVIRRPDQLEAAWSAGVRTIYCEFEDPKRYRETVATFRLLQTMATADEKPKTEKPPSGSRRRAFSNPARNGFSTRCGPPRPMAALRATTTTWRFSAASGCAAITRSISPIRSPRATFCAGMVWSASPPLTTSTSSSSRRCCAPPRLPGSNSPFTSTCRCFTWSIACSARFSPRARTTATAAGRAIATTSACATGSAPNSRSRPTPAAATPCSTTAPRPAQSISPGSSRSAPGPFGSSFSTKPRKNWCARSGAISSSCAARSSARRSGGNSS